MSLTFLPFSSPAISRTLSCPSPKRAFAFLCHESLLIFFVRKNERHAFFGTGSGLSVQVRKASQGHVRTRLCFYASFSRVLITLNA